MFNTLLPISARPVSLGQLARDVDRLFEMTSRVAPSFNQGTHAAWPGLNAWQDGSDFIVEAEIPGFSIDDIQVDVSEDTITVRGQREQHTPEGATTLRRERSVSRFERSLRLPAPIDAEGVDASLTNGVLQIRMPIAQSARPRRVQIKAGQQGQIGSASSSRGALPGKPETKSEQPEPAAS